MKIEEQVLTIEQMTHLKELGVEVKDTALCWYDDCVNGTDTFFEEDLSECVLTLTLQEILEMLPDHIAVEDMYMELRMNLNECSLYYSEYKSGKILKSYAFMGNKLKAAYKMLCWVAQNGYLNKE